MAKAQALRVDVKPQLLRWARERSRLDSGMLAHRFPKLAQWENEQSRPTLKQLEEFARATHTPFGFLFLPEPPVEPSPIPDFRTIANRPVARPSPDLLDTIYLCQQRQEWYRDFAVSVGERPLPFAGYASRDSGIGATADEIRRILHFDLDERRQCPTSTDALRRLMEQIDAAGVLVMVNGVVGSNTHRKLDPDEFRGFALADDLAPVIFVNGSDSKSGQMFTLAHELAHIWLGQSALTDAEPSTVPEGAQSEGKEDHIRETEDWCNRVAAELLVPLTAFRNSLRAREDLPNALNRLAREYKVSTLVVLRRMYDAGALTRDAMWRAYAAELQRLREIERAGGGGDFYRTLGVRTGQRFARALVASTVGGETLYRDALHLLGFSRLSAFDELARRLEIA